MKIQISKNKYINALAILALFSAAVHMTLLSYKAIYEKDLYILNYFNVLDLDIFFGNAFKNFWGNAISAICAGLIYLIILKTNKLEK